MPLGLTTIATPAPTLHDCSIKHCLKLTISRSNGSAAISFRVGHAASCSACACWHLCSVATGRRCCQVLVHDLLPIQLAEFFKDSNAKELHEHWLAMIAAQDEAICVSKATADVYEEWIATNSIDTSPAFHTDWVHSGADLEGSKSSCGLPSNAAETLRILKSHPTFLAVSTLEPRKAQAQILDAVERLWATGEDVNLAFVGQQGWKIDALVDRINSHPENGKRLFWLKGISDEYLDRVYQASTCLVAASINEGFGLPLIEAGRHAVPIIARDIPIFREVAGQSAFYFTGETGEQLSAAMSEWLQLYRAGNAPFEWNALVDLAAECGTTQDRADRAALPSTPAFGGYFRAGSTRRRYGHSTCGAKRAKGVAE